MHPVALRAECQFTPRATNDAMKLLDADASLRQDTARKHLIVVLSPLPPDSRCNKGTLFHVKCDSKPGKNGCGGNGLRLRLSLSPRLFALQLARAAVVAFCYICHVLCPYLAGWPKSNCTAGGARAWERQTYTYSQVVAMG